MFFFVCVAKICIDYTPYGHIATTSMLWLATLLFYPFVSLSMLNARQTVNESFSKQLIFDVVFGSRLFLPPCMCGVDNDTKSID